MDIDLDVMLNVSHSLDVLAHGLTRTYRSPGPTGDGEVDAVLQRVQAAAAAARRSREADLTELADGIGRLRALWITTENSLAAVPQ